MAILDTNMNKLIESCLPIDSICRVILVISNCEGATGIKTARNYGIETIVVPFPECRQRNLFKNTVLRVRVTPALLYKMKAVFDVRQY